MTMDIWYHLVGGPLELSTLIENLVREREVTLPVTKTVEAVSDDAAPDPA